MRSLMSGLTMLLVVGIVGSVQANVGRIQLPGKAISFTSGGGQMLAAASISSPVLSQQEEIVFAQVTLDATLPVGTEIEIWPAKPGGTEPDSTFGRNIWIVDENSGTNVRFDVTRIVKAWEAGALADNGFVFSTVAPETEAGSPDKLAAEGTSSTGLELTNLVLSYHTGPKPASVPTDRRKRVGPGAEDGAKGGSGH